MKIDRYIKVVLTVIAIFLGIIIIKDVDFVTKAHAGEKEIDLSALKLEQTTNANDEGEITFFIYENRKIEKPFSNTYELFADRAECEISDKDVPLYIITNKKAKAFSSFKIKRYAD